MAGFRPAGKDKGNTSRDKLAARYQEIDKKKSAPKKGK
jgi:hypothetical protein